MKTTMKMSPHESDLIARAAALLLKRAEREGCAPQEASAVDSDYNAETGIVTLRNCRGDLGAYRYNPKTDRLSFIQP